MNSKWKNIKAAFLKEHFDSNITLKSWCSKMNLSYHSTRRYIKVREENRTYTMRKNINAQKDIVTLKDLDSNRNEYKNQCFTGNCISESSRDTNTKASNIKKRNLSNEHKDSISTDCNMVTYGGVSYYQKFIDISYPGFKKGLRHQRALVINLLDKFIQII